MSEADIQALSEGHFGRWKNREAIAETLIPVIGKLYRERNIIVQVYGRNLVNRYRDFCHQLIANHDWPITELLFEGELVFIIRKS